MPLYVCITVNTHFVARHTCKCSECNIDQSAAVGHERNAICIYVCTRIHIWLATAAASQCCMIDMRTHEGVTLHGISTHIYVHIIYIYTCVRVAHVACQALKIMTTSCRSHCIDSYALLHRKQVQWGTRCARVYTYMCVCVFARLTSSIIHILCIAW